MADGISALVIIGGDDSNTNAAILAESGLSADEISQLIAAGAVVTNKD